MFDAFSLNVKTFIYNLCYRLVSIVIVGLLLSPFTGYGQLSDLHYLPPLKQQTFNTDYGVQDQRIYLSTPDSDSFKVNVFQGASDQVWQTFDISKTTSASFDLPKKNSADGDNNITFVRDVNTGEVLTSSGLRFESENGEEFYVNLRGNGPSHGSSLTSKGRAALGKSFKWGGVPNLGGNPTNATLGLMATEDNTTINISDFAPNTTFRRGLDINGITADDLTIELDAGESYVLEAVISQNNNSTYKAANKDGWLGASIISNKNIAVSVGAFLFQPSATGIGQDSGMDQIIPENVLGKEYVFVRGYSNDDNIETALILATQNDTQIYLNNSIAPAATINKGEYYQVKGDNYSGSTAGSNMFVRASKEVYAFQSLSGQDTRQADLNFIAPVNFLLNNEVDYIPRINEVAGGTTIEGGITIISAASTPDSEVEVFVDGVKQSLSGKRKAVDGSSLWVTYFLDRLTGDVSVKSSGSIAVGYVGKSGVIGVSGYFSGFATIPSIDVDVKVVGECLQDGNVSLAAPQGYSIYQWYLEGNPVSGATQSTLVPTLPGSYTVGITQSADGKEYVSAPVDVSDCLPEIKLDVTSTKQTPEVNESITLRVNYKYQSFFSASSAEVLLSIPSNFEITANNPSVGSWSNSTRKWTIGNVSPGDEEVLELTLKALSVGNPVTVSASNSQTVYGSDNTTLLNEGNNITDDSTEVFNIKNTTVISASSPISKTALDADFNLAATSNNPNPISYASSDEGVVRVASDGTVSIVSEGTAIITLSQLASSSYGPGTNTVTITVSKVTPTLSGFPDVTKTFGDPNFQITAPISTGDGGFSYTSSDTSVATVNSSTGEITIKASGSSTITATQAATSNYNTQSIQAILTVNKADQVISVGSLPDGKTILELVGPGGDNLPITVSATASSGDPVTITATFDSSTSQTGTFSSNILSSVSGAGILMFDFTVSASTNYNAASTSVSLDVSKRPQNIDSASMPSTATYQENLSIPLVASSPSSTAMVYTLVSGPATIVSGELVISGTGVIKYTINNSGDNTYATAPEVTKELEITQGTTTLSSFSISDKTYGDASFSIPIPTSNRTGTFVYSSNNPAVASIVGGNIQVNTPGTVTVTATQPSTSNWTTGTITTTFEVLKATPVFTGSTALSKLTIDSDFNYPLTSSVPSNPIVYRSSDPSVATVNSSTGLISIQGIGTAEIRVTQEATNNFNAGSKTLNLTVSKADPTLGPVSDITKTMGEANFFAPAPTSDSGGSFNFISSDTGVATVDAATGEVTIIGTGTSTLSISQAATANYNSASTSMTLTVTNTPAELAFVAQPQNTEFDQSMSDITVEILDANGNRVTNNTSSVTLSIANNAASGTLSGPATVNAVSGLATFSGLSINNAGEGYTLKAISTGLTSATSSAFDVTKRMLTITAPTLTKSKTYDGNTSAVVTAGALSGVASGDNVTVSAVATYDDSTLGTAKTITVAYTLGGADASNYTTPANFEVFDGEITKANLNFTISEIPNQTFTGSAIEPSVEVKSGSTTLQLNLDYSLIYSNNINAGTANVTVSALGNYTGNKEVTFNITPAPLTITAENKSKEYGAVDPALTVSYAGFVNGEDATDLGGTLAISRAAGEGAGTYAITASGQTSDNYALRYETGTLTITEKSMTDADITVDAIADLIYTGNAQDPPVVVKDGTTNLTEGTDYSLSYADNINVGIAKVTINGIGNYSGTKSQVFTITKAALTITAENKSKTFGVADPEFTVTYSGLVNGEQATVLGGALTTTRKTGEEVGDYMITVSGQTSDNYALRYETGTLTITEKSMTDADITVDAIADLIYTGNAQDPPVVVKDGTTNLTEGTDYTLSYSDNVNAGTAFVRIQGINNYSGLQNKTFEIVKAPLVIRADDRVRTYGFGSPALTFSYEGLVNGEARIEIEPSISTLATDSSPAGVYPIELTGGVDPNYEIKLVNGTLVIGRKALTIRADDKARTYGFGNPALTFTYEGLVNGDKVIETEPGIGTAATQGSNVGTYPITLTGGSDDNYDIELQAGELKVMKASLTIIAEDQSKVYDLEDPEFTYSVAGLIGSDKLTGSLSRESGEDVGKYSITLGSLTAGDNYQTTYSAAQLEIIPTTIKKIIEIGFVPMEWGSDPDLPIRTTLMATNGKLYILPITWDVSALDKFSRGSYLLDGNIGETSWLSNPEGIKASLKVVVHPKSSPRDVTLSNSSFEGSPKDFFISVGNFVVDDPVDDIHVVELYGEGYDNRFFEIKDNIFFWSSAERAEGKSRFTVIVQVTDRDGNTLEKFFEIQRVRPTALGIEIFKSFTPNGDGRNDSWGVPGLRFYGGVRIQVFERSGARVFYTEDPDIRWDGTHKGKKLPAGTYHWIIEVGETGEVRKGMLNLLTK